MSIPDPIVLLDARAKYVHPAFQMTRASTKTVWDSAGRLVTVPANALGWDHDPATGQTRGYLAEPSATNLLLHSNDLSDSAWSLNNSPTVTPNAIVGPDGAGMARVERTASGATSIFQAHTIVSGETVCGSFIAKAGEITAIGVRVGARGGHVRYAVSLIDGSTVLPPTTGGTNASQVELVGYGVEDLGGGFWRPWVAGRLAPDTTSATTHALLWGGGVGDGVYVGYVQTEKRSYPTSYIETGGATATRAGDGLTCSTSSLPWRNSRGAVVIDTDIAWWLAGAVLFSWGNDIVVRCADSGSRLVLLGTSLNSTRTLASSLGKLRLAITWDEAEANAAVNGSLISNPVSITSPPSSGTIGVGSRFSGADSWAGPVHRAVYYPASLSNADLQSLTAIQE